MSPAPRRPQNRGLEPNLHPHPKGFRYKDPRTGKYRYFGEAVTREAANKVARTLNRLLATHSSLVDRIAGQESRSLRSAVESFITEKLPTQSVCDRSRDNRRYILRKLQAIDLASYDVSSITTRDVAVYLKTLSTDSMKQLYRAQRSPHRQHHTQILRTQASREFTAVGSGCDLFAGVKNPPTLYECKSPGVAQLRQQGWSMEAVRRLAGHRSARMTEHYGRGHEAPFDPVGLEPDGPRSVTEVLPVRWKQLSY